MTKQESIIPAIAITQYATGKSCWVGTISEWTQALSSFPTRYKPAYYTLLYITGGNGMLTIDGDSLTVKSSMVLLMQPHCIYSGEMNRLRGCVILFTHDFFSLRYNSNQLEVFSFGKQIYAVSKQLNNEQEHKWTILTELIQQEFIAGKENSVVMLRSYVNLLLCELERTVLAGKEVGVVNARAEKVRQFEALLEKHYVKEKAPSFYAGMLCITTNYLNRLCKEIKAETSGDIIRSRIMLEAQRLLLYTTLTVCEVGYKIGFESCSYFITLFKKQFLVTPEQYRKVNGH